MSSAEIFIQHIKHWSGSTLFAGMQKIALRSLQEYSADDKQTTFLDAVFLGALRVKMALQSSIWTLNILAMGISVDPELMPQNTATNQYLHYLPVVQQSLDTWTFCKMDLLPFRTSMVRN